MRLQHYDHIRDYAERWQWTDPQTHQLVTGYDPPESAPDAHRLPFHIKALTKKGELIDDRAVCLSVDTRLHLRTLRVESRPYPIDVYDSLIIEIDGIQFFQD